MFAEVLVCIVPVEELRFIMFKEMFGVHGWARALSQQNFVTCPEVPR
jgi:hypothetical protein